MSAGQHTNVAIIGAGAIGSSFAFALSRGGHAVSVVARGRRLEQLRADRAIVTTANERAVVTPLEALPAEVRFELVLVTVLPTQVEEVMPQLLANPSPVMFMFNAFDGHLSLRERIGRERFSWGFPAIVVALRDGRLEVKSDPSRLELLQITTLGGLVDHQPAWLAPWRERLEACGIPTALEADMVAWLRTHVAFILPLMIAGLVTTRRGAGLTFREAHALAKGARRAFELVEALGHRITPKKLWLLARLPSWLFASTLHVLSRTSLARSAVTGVAEATFLLGQLEALDPTRSPELSAMKALLTAEVT